MEKNIDSFFVRYCEEFTEDLFNYLMKWGEKNSSGVARDFNDTYEFLSEKTFPPYSYNFHSFNFIRNPENSIIGYGIDNHRSWSINIIRELSVEGVKKLTNYTEVCKDMEVNFNTVKVGDTFEDFFSNSTTVVEKNKTYGYLTLKCITGSVDNIAKKEFNKRVKEGKYKNFILNNNNVERAEEFTMPKLWYCKPETKKEAKILATWFDDNKEGQSLVTYSNNISSVLDFGLSSNYYGYCQGPNHTKITFNQFFNHYINNNNNVRTTEKQNDLQRNDKSIRANNSRRKPRFTGTKGQISNRGGFSRNKARPCFKKTRIG